MKLQQLLRDLKITIKNKDHTKEELQAILGKLQEIGNIAVMKLKMNDVPYVKIVENIKEKG